MYTNIDVVRGAKEIFVSSQSDRKLGVCMEICKNGASGTKSRKSAHANAQKGINGDLKGRQTIKRAEEMREKSEEME